MSLRVDRVRTSGLAVACALAVVAALSVSDRASAEGNYYCYGGYLIGASCDGPYVANLKSNRVASDVYGRRKCAGRADYGGTAFGGRICGAGTVLACFRDSTRDARARLKNESENYAQVLQGYWAQHTPDDCTPDNWVYV